MAVMNNREDNLRAEIASIRKKIRLSESQEEIAILTEKIQTLMEELKLINRKKPKVVPVKDAKTIGDKMESKLKSNNHRSTMGNKSLLI